MVNYTQEAEQAFQDYFKKKKTKVTGIDYFDKEDPYVPSEEAEQAFQEYLKNDVAEAAPISPQAEPKDRGFFGDIVSNVARGVPRLGTMAGYALKTLDPEGGIDVIDRLGQKVIDKSKDIESWDIMRPDASEKAGEGFIKRGIKGGLESSIPSLAPMLAGAGTGMIAGSVFPVLGTAVGGLVGATIGTLGIFGLGVYGEKKEEYLGKGIAEPEAHKAALNQGLIEGGIETASNLVGMMTFGFGKLAAQPLKQTAKELLRTPVKTFAKNLTKNALLNEVPTEMIQGALGAKVEEGFRLVARR